MFQNYSVILENPYLILCVCVFLCLCVQVKCSPPSEMSTWPPLQMSSSTWSNSPRPTSGEEGKRQGPGTSYNLNF